MFRSNPSQALCLSAVLHLVALGFLCEHPQTPLKLGKTRQAFPIHFFTSPERQHAQPPLKRPLSSPPQIHPPQQKKTIKRTTLFKPAASVTPCSGNIPPDYPIQARRNGIEGTVILRLYITQAGRVSYIQVLTPNRHKILISSAIQAVQKWRFSNLGSAKKKLYEVDVPIVFSLTS